MAHKIIFSVIQDCIDSYMQRMGKHEIGEIEANSVLARQGLLVDDERNPGEPLRQVLTNLRDSNLLPRNIRQRFGAWHIRNSHALQSMQQVLNF